MSDWREIDISTPIGMRQLDREIAERSGMRVEPIPEKILHWYGKDIPFSTGFDEYYVHVSWRHEPFKIEISKGADVWEYLLYETEWIPEYSDSDNATPALELLTSTPTTFNGVECDNGTMYWCKWTAYINRFHPRFEVKAVASTASMAICKAWLTWSDQQNAAARGKAEGGQS